ncbi:MAG: hypothetical protein ACI8XO_003256 [Verrucomicrobiales bacterium]|jgi:hypothetical protein
MNRQILHLICSSVIATSLVNISNAAPPNSASPGLVRQIKVLPDQAPDCTSLKTIVDSVTRDCPNNDAKAIAIYNFMRLSHYHRAYPNEPGGVPALKEINSYGWSLCGGLHAVQSSLWRELGWDWRFVGWDGHTTVEAKYDDRWHYLDVFLKFYAWMPDGSGGRTIAGQDQLTGDLQGLIQDAFVFDPGHRVVYMKNNAFRLNGDKANWRAPEFLCCGDALSGVISGLKTHRVSGRSEGWAGIKHANDGYSAQVNLASGFSLENTWDPIPDAWFWLGQKASPAHTCGGHKDTRNSPGYGLVLEPYVNSKPARSYANGILTFAPDFSTAAGIEAFARVDNVKHANNALVPAEAGKPGIVVFNLASPYLLTRASGEATGADKIEVSVDGGKTFKLARLEGFTELVKGQTAALIKVTFTQPLKALKIRAIVQNNPGALPYLSPGKNVVTVSVADGAALGDNQLVVTYGYRLGSRSKSFDQLCDEGKEIAKQHNARWSDRITCVRKVFSAKDLPATFEIACPTPKGQHPVYPRMMFVRREVIAPGSAPMPLPDGAVAATVGGGEELLSLPNPFLVGSEALPVFKVRPVRTIKIPMRYEQYMDENGKVSKQGTLRWPKNEGENGKVIASALGISGELEKLKGLHARSLAAARLVVPVSAGHDKTASKLGVVFLKQAIASGKAADVRGLGDVSATAIIPKQADGTPKYQPAKRIAIDVARPIKAIASSDLEFHGLALRMVPDRGIDNGWTVRCDIAPKEEILLEIDVYDD